MNTYYLKAQDIDSLWQGLIDKELAETTSDGDNVFVGYSEDDRLFFVGEIRVPTGNMITNEDGVELPELQLVDGYHANLILENNVVDFSNTAIEVLEVDNPVMKF